MDGIKPLGWRPGRAQECNQAKLKVGGVGIPENPAALAASAEP